MVLDGGQSRETRLSPVGDACGERPEGSNMLQLEIQWRIRHVVEAPSSRIFNAYVYRLRGTQCVLISAGTFVRRGPPGSVIMFPSSGEPTDATASRAASAVVGDGEWPAGAGVPYRAVTRPISKARPLFHARPRRAVSFRLSGFLLPSDPRPENAQKRQRQAGRGWPAFGLNGAVEVLESSRASDRAIGRLAFHAITETSASSSIADPNQPQH
ncbi:hypothetical protein B0T24DRAFT_8595 [Lasiosphaeria ovina]|uniref:Uncharacterized protein n=1 Tax=Lasiosphaeria ovina TaxID=92902 RepID=A0AAE0TWU7_9PEZI|nr:hypothetical protein B0T24DRAFT_8595 [Lasiosphaeria ovina]